MVPGMRSMASGMPSGRSPTHTPSFSVRMSSMRLPRSSSPRAPEHAAGGAVGVGDLVGAADDADPGADLVHHRAHQPARALQAPRLAQQQQPGGDEAAGGGDKGDAHQHGGGVVGFVAPAGEDGAELGEGGHQAADLVLDEGRAGHDASRRLALPSLATASVRTWRASGA